jgi:hypothetical protein
MTAARGRAGTIAGSVSRAITSGRAIVPEDHRF